MSSLGTPWSPRSRQEQGLAEEVKLARERGKRRHPGSGSGSIKGDASDNQTVEEYKLAAKSFKLNGKELRDSYLKAMSQGRAAIWVIVFDEYDIEVELRVSSR